MTELIGSLFILAGSIFLFSAGLGLLRMPDAFARIQVGTKATTLGAMLALIGLAIYHPGWTFKLVLIVYFVFVSNPVSSHALARAAHRTGVAKQPGPDALAPLDGRPAAAEDAGS